MDRIYRFSIPGITFFIVFASYTYVFTGFNFFKDEWAALVSALLSSPIVGLIVSSIRTGIDHIRKDKNGKPHIYTIYLKNNIDPKMLKFFTGVSRQPNKTSEWKSFYWKYQSFIRENLEDETLRFTAGRWTAYNIHKNNTFCIISGFTFAVISIFANDLHNNANSLIWGAVGFVVLVIYIIAGNTQAKFAKQDALNVEYISAMKKLKF